jgi:hypothetical protein
MRSRPFTLYLIFLAYSVSAERVTGRQTDYLQPPNF